MLFYDVYHILYDNFFIALPRCGCSLSLTRIFLSYSLVGQDDDLPQVRADTTVNMNPILHVLCQANEASVVPS